jgi:hypothetical protein
MKNPFKTCQNLWIHLSLLFFAFNLLNFGALAQGGGAASLPPSILVDGNVCYPPLFGQGCTGFCNTVEICKGESVQFEQDVNSNDKYYPGATMTWQFNGSNLTGTITDNTVNPVYNPVWNTPGTYYVYASISPADCNINDFITQIIVHDFPDKFPAPVLVTPDPICAGETVCFEIPDATTLNNNGSSVQYDFGDGNGGSAPGFMGQPIPSQVCNIYSSAGTFDFSLTVTNSHGCSTPRPTASVNIVEPNPIYTATASATWSYNNNPFNNTNQPVELYGLVIPEGVSITINNMEFRFVGNSKAVVKSGNSSIGGGKLILNNSTFTVFDGCFSDEIMWKGVEVWGKPGVLSKGSPMDPNYPHGYLKLSNSEISHAKDGVTTIEKDNQGNFVWSHRGGVVQGYSATFLNNSRDIEFLGSGLPNASYFYNCDFVTDGQLNDPSVGLRPHVTLNAIKSVRFAGCNFENKTPQFYTSGSYGKGYGIYSNDAHYTVTRICQGLSLGGKCLSPINSTFKELSHGIWATASNPVYSVNIRYSDFERTLAGVSLYGVDNSIVVNNSFETAVTGVFMNGCEGYTVENNQFTAMVVNKGSRGIVVHNSGTGAEDIYHNSFYDSSNPLRVGIQTQSTNDNLLVRCNNFNPNAIFTTDIAAASGTVRNLQGGCVPVSDPPADNLFSYTATKDYWANDGVNGAIGISYQHSPDPSSTYNLAPRNGYYNINNTFPSPCINMGSANLSQTCPKTTYSNRIAYYGLMKDVRAKADSLRELVDGHNTDGLISLINTGSNGQVKNELMNVSPYLSDKALITYVEGNAPNGHLKQVITANSPVTEKVMEVVKNRNLPKGIQKQIDAEQIGISPRRLLEMEINGYERQREVYKKYVIQSFMHDSTAITEADTLFPFEPQLDSLKEFLAREKDYDFFYKTPEDKNRLEDVHHKMVVTEIAKEDFTEAQQLMSECSDSCEYCQYCTKMMDIQQTAEKEQILLTDVARRSDMEQIAYSGSEKQPAVLAQSMLAYAFNDTLPIIIEPLVFTTQNRIAANQGGRNISENKSVENNFVDELNGDYLRVYPNPTNAQLTVDYSFANIEQPAQFVIYDLFGRVVYSQMLIKETGMIQIEVNHLSQGMYTYNFVVNNKLISANKLIINK